MSTTQHQASMLGVAIALLSALLLAFASPARATFPGGDGKIAYESNRDTNFEIYVSNTDQTETRLTSNAADDRAPAWSPDGSKIAFSSDRDGNPEIYVMNADGSGQTRLTNNAAVDLDPSWSGDGTQIVFTSSRDGDPDIWKMNANGTGVVQIVNSAGFDVAPNWSPDGKKIAFVTDRNGNNEIYKMNPDGTLPQRLTTNSAVDNHPDWSPDSKRIIWDSFLSGNFDVWSMNADGSGKSNLTGFTATAQTNPTWAPDNGNYAYSTDQDGDQEIVSTNCCQRTNNTAVDDAPSWQPAIRPYVRPKGATPIRLALVPAYDACSSPNTLHQGSITSNSCNPPIPSSQYLTVGTPTANGKASNSIGSVSLSVICNGGAPNEGPPCLTTPGDQLDGKLAVSFLDVRCSQGTSGGCGDGLLSDYQGDLLFKANVRITDENSIGSGGATVADLPLTFSVPCTITPGGPDAGSACADNTTLDAIFGGSAVIEQARAIWHFDDAKLMDGGSDGVAATEGDNTVLAWTGLFFP